MTKILSEKKRNNLRKAGIRHYEKLIHQQSKEWLIEHFKKGADEYAVNVSLLIRNIIWQLRHRIQTRDREPLNELIRTAWYMYIKPTLTRVNALSAKTDQYNQMIAQIVYMVKEIEVLRYKEIGFRNEGQAYQQIGGNANIILIAEKLGYQGFLNEMAKKYSITTIALGGQPSVLNIEYFVDELRNRKINLRRSFYLFSIVDYDPSGWIIQNAFIENLKFYGLKYTKTFELITPDMLTQEEIKMSKYLLPAGKGMTAKNRDWIKQIKKRAYKNQKYLFNISGRGLPARLYGLESESISTKRLEEKLKEVMVPLIGKTEDLLKIYELKKLDKNIKNLILHKLTT